MPSSSSPTNVGLLFLAPLPSLVLVWLATRPDSDGFGDGFGMIATLRRWYIDHPYGFMHMLFGINIDVGFWLVGLAQGTFWLIDPYWTLFPPLAALFFLTHPGASRSGPQIAATILTLIWSVRLTHSYFRRERWAIGAREDWRYADMARDHKGRWWLLSFFAVGVAQHFMLVPLVYPIFSLGDAKEGGVAWQASDACSAAIALAGITLACVADNALHRYCTLAKGKKPKVLCTGVWGYSRHPNYVGEQVWWFALASFAACRGDLFALHGPIINSLVLVLVTRMTEERMMTTWTRDRRAAYQAYRKRTSAWIPWPII